VVKGGAADVVSWGGSPVICVPLPY
jgi:hypothetical protein